MWHNVERQLHTSWDRRPCYISPHVEANEPVPPDYASGGCSCTTAQRRLPTFGSPAFRPSAKRRIFRSFDEMIVFVKDSIGKYKHYSIREITHTGIPMWVGSNMEKHVNEIVVLDYFASN